jgi:hypothetical protein
MSPHEESLRDAVRLLAIIAAPLAGRDETVLERQQREAASACLARIHGRCPDVVADSRSEKCKMMKFTLEIELVSGDTGDIPQILHLAAAKMESGHFDENEPLTDLRGNRVGAVALERS